MNKNFSIILFLAVVLAACSSKVETTPSSDATVSRFYFAADSRWPGLGEASFEIDDRVDTGWITPSDSLRFGTRLDSVVPRFTFSATPTSAYLTLGDTTLLLTGTDTLDFNRTPIYVTITAADTKTVKVYEIFVYAHQSDPDLYTWQELTPAICPSEPMETKALLAEDIFYFYTNNGFQTRLYTSPDARTWTAEAAPTGLPNDCGVRTICYCDSTGLFYYADKAGIYTSMDGISWVLVPIAGYEPETMLMSFNDRPWLLLRETGETKLLLACIEATGAIDLYDEVPDDFPTYGFAAVEYTDAGHYRHGLIAGGFNRRGTMVSSVYNIEVASKPDEDYPDYVYRMTDYSFYQSDKEPFAYRAYVPYADQLESYGGVNSAMQLSDSIRFSMDAGMNWEVADTAVSVRPESYRERYETSVLTDGEYIYLIGGQGAEGVYTDVYRAKLNSIDW